MCVCVEKEHALFSLCDHSLVLILNKDDHSLIRVVVDEGLKTFFFF